MQIFVIWTELFVIFIEKKEIIKFDWKRPLIHSSMEFRNIILWKSNKSEQMMPKSTFIIILLCIFGQTIALFDDQ